MADSQCEDSRKLAFPQLANENTFPQACDPSPTVCHVRVDVVAPPLNRVLVVTAPVRAGDAIVTEPPIYVQRSSYGGLILNHTELYERLTPAQREFIENLEPTQDDVNLELSPKVDFFRRAFKNNSHSLGGSLNSGVFSHISFAEHSCRPNAFFIASHSTNRGTLVAMRDLFPGDRVTISYVRPPHGYSLQVWPRWMRRLCLSRQRGFNCACDFCVKNDDGSQPGPASSFFSHACEELRAFFESGELEGADVNVISAKRIRFLEIALRIENSLMGISEKIQAGEDSVAITKTDLVFYYMHLCKTMFEFHLRCFSHESGEATNFTLALQYLERWCSSFPADVPEGAFAAHECLSLLFDIAWETETADRPKLRLGMEQVFEEVRGLWRSFGSIKCYWMPHLGVKLNRKSVYTDYLETFGSHGDELPTMEKLLRDLRAAHCRLSNDIACAEQAPPTKRLKHAHADESSTGD